MPGQCFIFFMRQASRLKNGVSLFHMRFSIVFPTIHDIPVASSPVCGFLQCPLFCSIPAAIHVQKTDETVKVSVTDHGTGIPIEYVPRLFERY